jgi:uncharacterized protein YndB with AHSA1/START domain
MLTTLADALPDAEFTEFHDIVIDAPAAQVWAALSATAWTDLWLTRPLVILRGLRPAQRETTRSLLDGGPVVPLYREPCRYAAGGRIARPWKPRPELGPAVMTLDDLAAPVTGSWLKYGMDFRLHDLPGGRTRLSTFTLCQPTDAVARRAFGRYWLLIRPFSGLIRRDVLHAVARRARADGPSGVLSGR